MMKQMTLLSTLSLALLASYGAHAAETAELKVGGTISPAACSLTLDSAGSVDFGIIRSSSLNDSAGTQLTPKSVGLAIACDGLAKFALKLSDNRADSLVPGLAAIAGGSDAKAFGLGKAGSKNIGVFTMSFSGATSTTIARVNHTFSSDKQNWRWENDSVIFPLGYYLGWYSDSTYSPASLKDVKTTINITPVIDKKNNLPIDQQIKLDGSATLELVYL